MTDWTRQAIRLLRCPRCNYDLGALPRSHRCPECGFVYDEKMFVLEGWRLPGLRAWWRSMIVGAPLAFIVLGMLRAEFGVSWSRILWIITGLSVVVVVLYAYVWRRDQSGRGVMIRYLITEDGVARPGKRARTYLWRNYSHVMLLSAGEDSWRLHMYPTWWRLFGPPLVNARLECEQAEAEAVRYEIQRRISAARRAEAASPSQGLPRRWW